MPQMFRPLGTDFEQLARQHLLLRRALDVDDGRLARNRDAFFERADPHVRHRSWP